MSAATRPHEDVNATRQLRCTTTADVIGAQERLARLVHNDFRRKLSLEDARDVAAETIAEIHGRRGRVGYDISRPCCTVRRSAMRWI